MNYRCPNGAALPAGGDVPQRTMAEIFGDSKLMDLSQVTEVADVIIQRGSYQCAACGSMLVFEACDIKTAQFAVGFCGRGHDCYDADHMASNCRMWKVRLKVPLERLQCEVLP